MSREVTDAMVRAAAEVYLGEVFLPEDITDKQNSGALMLARKVLEAALSASPTRAQAASAGEHVSAGTAVPSAPPCRLRCVDPRKCAYCNPQLSKSESSVHVEETETGTNPIDPLVFPRDPKEVEAK